MKGSQLKTSVCLPSKFSGLHFKHHSFSPTTVQFWGIWSKWKQMEDYCLKTMKHSISRGLFWAPSPEHAFFQMSLHSGLLPGHHGQGPAPTLLVIYLVFDVPNAITPDHFLCWIGFNRPVQKEKEQLAKAVSHSTFKGKMQMQALLTQRLALGWFGRGVPPKQTVGVRFIFSGDGSIGQCIFNL